MTLGEFRNISKDWPDNLEIWAGNDYYFLEKVYRVFINNNIIIFDTDSAEGELKIKK